MHGVGSFSMDSFSIPKVPEVDVTQNDIEKTLEANNIHPNRAIEFFQKNESFAETVQKYAHWIKLGNILSATYSATNSAIAYMSGDIVMGSIWGSLALYNAVMANISTNNAPKVAQSIGEYRSMRSFLTMQNAQI